ncbi:hypothetical protein BDN71DRAFT_1457596 [Pleurotus eryngii]|uniref:Uncharacterized protein n=1 Tax=Pleurotus eryngii TaxID=5323 RepID=A0A9P5ZJI8_PLEER|nr:hypothetical protein BDN71DRAFT_1457596 [Pleurotus eryngii]
MSQCADDLPGIRATIAQGADDFRGFKGEDEGQVRGWDNGMPRRSGRSPSSITGWAYHPILRNTESRN